MAYIYVITNQLNGKQYVGKTLNNPTQRFKEHCRDSKKERSKELLLRIEDNVTNRSENINSVNKYKSVVLKWEELLES